MSLTKKVDKICKGCGSEMVKKMAVNHPFFRHLDFTTISKSGCLYKCSECQIVSNPDVSANEAPTFETESYAASRQTEHTIKVDEYSQPVTRSFLQAKILADNIIQHDQPKILDIGCFDGQLLFELDILLPEPQLYGFDINFHLEAVFPKKNNFRFISSNLEEIDTHFDLITLSHSILYICDFSKLMFTISKLLKDDGSMFIQIPDISLNPFYTLMGDQCFIFTKNSLRNVLQRYGFSTSKINSGYFSRELLFVAKKKVHEMNIAEAYLLDDTVEHTIETLESKRKKLLNMSDSGLLVLGTTVNASYVDEILQERIECFLDENPRKTGTTFRGKKVLHPSQLTHNQHTILPYGESGRMIEKRFRELYQGSFTVV